MSVQYTQPYTPLLVALYVLVFLLALYQIVLIYCHGHKLASFNFGFLCLCVLFCAVRVIFWIVETDDDTSYHIMYWFPINIQFGMFYLVMLYIMRLVQRSESSWNSRQKSLVFWISVAINATFFLATCGWVIFCGRESDNSKEDACSSTHAVFAAMCFLILGLSLLFYGVKLHIIASREALARDKAMQGGQNIPSQVRWGPNESRFRTEAICFLLLTVFITRAVFDLMQLELFNSHPLSLSNHKNGKDITDALVFWMYVVWEIFPTALMLFFFGTAVTAAGGVSAHQARYVRERLTITDPSSLGTSCDALQPLHEREDQIIENGPNVLWPLPKEVTDVAVGGSKNSNEVPSRTPGLLEDDSRYDSPCDSLYGLSSPLPAHQAVSRGYYAAMAQPHYWPAQGNVGTMPAMPAAMPTQEAAEGDSTHRNTS